MTVTLKVRTAAVILAAFCVLAGLAIGQLTQAESARSGNARQLNNIARKLGSVNGHLVRISKQLGGTPISNINGQLDDVEGQLRSIDSHIGGTIGFDLNYRLRQIESSTRGTCRAVDGFGC